MNTEADKQPEVKVQHDEPYQFNLAPDNVGLALEHPGYGKKTCRRCEGRLFMRLLPGDGYSTTEVDASEKNGRKRLRAELHACVCVHRGYERVRHAFGRAVMALVPSYLAMEETEEPGYIDISFGVGGAGSSTNAGAGGVITIVSPAEEKKKAQEEAQQRLAEAMKAAAEDVLEQHFSRFKGVASTADAA